MFVGSYVYRSHFQSHKLHTNVVAGDVSFLAGPEVAVDALADPGAWVVGLDVRLVSGLGVVVVFVTFSCTTAAMVCAGVAGSWPPVPRVVPSSN